MEDLQQAFISYAFQLCAVLVTIASIPPIINYIVEEHRSTGTARYAPLEGAVVISFATLACCTISAIVGGLVALQIKTQR